MFGKNQKFDKDDKPIVTLLYIILICAAVVGYGAFAFSKNTNKNVTKQEVEKVQAKDDKKAKTEEVKKKNTTKSEAKSTEETTDTKKKTETKEKQDQKKISLSKVKYYASMTEEAEIYMTDDVNKIESSEIETFSKNSVVAVLNSKKNGDKEFCQIQYYNLKGWINKEKLLKLKDNKISYKLNTRVYVKADLDGTASMYEEKSDQSGVVKSFGYGNEVIILESEDNWAKISSEDSTGWIDIRYIGIYQPGNYFVNLGENDTLLVRNDANAAANVVNEIPQSTVVNIKEFENGWGKVTYGGIEGWVNLSFLALCDEDYVGAESVQTTPVATVTSTPAVVATPTPVSVQSSSTDSAPVSQDVTTNTSSDYNYETPVQQEQPAAEPEPAEQPVSEPEQPDQSASEPATDTSPSDELQWNDDELTWN